MITKKSTFLSLVALASLVGCGGDGSNGGSGGGATTLETATTSLNQALAATTASSLAKATSDFDKAYKKTPGGRAALGYAIAASANAAQSALTLFDISARAHAGARSKRRTAKAKSALVAGLKRIRPLTALVESVGGSRLTLDSFLPATSLAVRSRAYPNDPTPAQVRGKLIGVADALEAVEARLSDANLDSLEATPLSVVYKNSDDQSKTVKLGSVEGYGLRSAVKAIHGVVDAALAYDFDTGGFDSNQDFFAKFETKIRANGEIAAAEYLPGGGFGKLTSGGGARLKALGTLWIGTADDGKTAIVKYRARQLASPNTGWLTDLADQAPSESDLVKAETDLNTFKTGLTASVPVSFSVHNPDTGEDETTTLSVRPAAYLDGDPPADIRAFFPALKATYADGDEFFLLTPVAGSIVDPTFGGLVDNSAGVPAPVLYDRELSGDTEGTSVSEIQGQAFAFFYYR